MAHINARNVYNQIVVRGHRNAPTYAEVKRDLADVNTRIEAVIGYRY